MSRSGPMLETIGVNAADPKATVVLVHGAWHGAWCWHDGFAQRLADQGISTLAPSLSGHAGSAPGYRLNRCRMRDYVADVTGLVAGLETPPVLVGHSMGGGVVQQVLSRPDRPPLAGAALLASMPPRGVVRITSQVARRSPGTFLLSNLTLDLGRLVATPEQVRDLFFTPQTSAEIVDATAARVQSESFRAFLDMLVLDRPRPVPTDVPVLVIGTEADPIFLPSEVAQTARAWGTEPVMFPDIGHDLMLDDGWEKVADHLATWVLSLAGTSAAG